MKNTFGNALGLTLFGESHGDVIGAVLDGISPGIPVSEERIARALALRRPAEAFATARRETDEFSVVSGVYRGKTTGGPLCILIPNRNAEGKDYEKIASVPRPGTADETAWAKFHGFQDARGGGHFSGRLTAPLVAVGAVLQAALEEKGIVLASHILKMGAASDRPLTPTEEELFRLRDLPFAVLEKNAEEAMRREAENAAREKDSIGGVVEGAVMGLPAGVGEPFFDTVEGVLSHAFFAVPAVKGVEFGAGFAAAGMRGSEHNDPYYCDKSGAARTRTNHCGGILGGITTGEPLLYRVAVKPVPSILSEQESFDRQTGENIRFTLSGRHDACLLPRARVVFDAVTAFCLSDLLLTRFGTDYFLNR